MKVERILETAVYADDLSQAELFYTRVLGLKLFAKELGRHLFFRCGNQMFLIFNPMKTAVQTEIAPHGAQGPGHMAFAVTLAEMDDWVAHLHKMEVVIEKDMLWPKGGRSLYFRDPAGNCLELASPSIWGLNEDNI